MKIPAKAKITLLICAGIGIGMGVLMYGLMLTDRTNSHDVCTYVSIGAGILSASLAALFAHCFGQFRDIRDDDHDELPPA
jgi:hypothetical protein